MRRIFVSTIFLITVMFSLTYGISKTNIINSGDYYYGTGLSYDFGEAKDQALKELTEQIAVRIASSFETKVMETTENISKSVQSIIRTHSTATLQNVLTISQQTSDGQIEVFCYLEKSKVNEIFSRRKKLIAGMVNKSEQLIRERNIAFALKNLYFASILLNSLPDQNVYYEGVNYSIEIPARINNIILDISLDFDKDRFLSEKEREITLKVNYDNRPISLLDFNFWDGSNQVSVQARDGLATFCLLGASVKFDKLKTNIKYAYYESRHEYSVVADLWPLVNRPDFNGQIDVPLVKSEAIPKKPVIAKQSEFNIELSCEDKNAPLESIARTTQQFLGLIENGDTLQISKQYSDDTFLQKKVKDYIKFNKARPLDNNIQAKLNKTRDGWELRRIRMLHNYPSVHKETTEYLVLDFSENGRLVDLNSSISDYLYQEFVKESKFGDDWGNRQEIIKFLEKYRTAYLVRDIETVDLMFADEALIIIGRILKSKPLPNDMVKYEKLGNQPDVEYLRLKKSDYIARQQQIFKSQKDIFLDFGSFDIIKKNNAPNIYGVEMRQSYVSTTYGDEGYLFLLIDFNEPDPLIYVRAWQPNAWSEDELIRTANFRIYK